MEKFFSYLISSIALTIFVSSMIIFNPIQWICLNLFGYQAHKKSVDCLYFILLRVGHLLGSTYKFENREVIPNGVPIIFVANHQGLFDIVVLGWFLRKFHPKFVSKKELGQWVPSVSYNLRHGGGVLIDRKDPKQAIPVIKELSERIEKNKHSAVIFPEGTRSKNGKPKEFATSGLKILCKYAPSAYIVPISINNSWKVFKWGFFPFGLGNHLTFVVHEPLAVKDYSFDEIFEKTRTEIINGIKN